MTKNIKIFFKMLKKLYEFLFGCGIITLCIYILWEIMFSLRKFNEKGVGLKMKRKFVLAIMIAVCLCLSACSMPGASVTDSLSPPKPSGELYDIQKALELSVGHGVNLVYPSAGNYRSAIVTKDIDSDGKLEVFSFYSSETDDKRRRNAYISHRRRRRVTPEPR